MLDATGFKVGVEVRDCSAASTKQDDMELHSVYRSCVMFKEWNAVCLLTACAAVVANVTTQLCFDMYPFQNKLYPREQNKDSLLYRGRIRVQLKNDDSTPCNPEYPTREFLATFSHTYLLLSCQIAAKLSRKFNITMCLFPEHASTGNCLPNKLCIMTSLSKQISLCMKEKHIFMDLMTRLACQLQSQCY